jgi:CO dehydrogenase nickel-insertion accessory protein CooC1
LRMKIVILGKGGCGKSTVTSLLAMGLAGNGLSVLVIDSDESNFGLHRLLGMRAGGLWSPPGAARKPSFRRASSGWRTSRRSA